MTPQSWSAQGASIPELADLVARAAADDRTAAAELVRRLAAGEGALARTVAAPGDPNAKRVRGALVSYLARGQWHGQPLPLAPGHHASHAGQHLREIVMQTACSERVPAWRATLFEALRDGDAVVRHTAAALLGQCHGQDAITSLVSLLDDPDESVRWAAAIALAHMDWPGIESVLRRLAEREVRPEMRHVAAYVLRHAHDLALREQVAPVVQALDGSNYRVEAPLAAEDALRRLAGPASIREHGSPQPR